MLRDLNALLVAAKWFKSALEHLKGISRDVEAAPEIRVAFFYPSPCLVLRARQLIKASLSTGGRGLRPRGITFLSRPKAEVEDHIQTEFQASQPHFLHLLINPPIKFRKMINRWIISVKTRHPFVMRKTDGRKLLFKLTSESRFSDAEKPVN